MEKGYSKKENMIKLKPYLKNLDKRRNLKIKLYQQAERIFESGDYNKATALFEELGEL